MSSSANNIYATKADLQQFRQEIWQRFDELSLKLSSPTTAMAKEHNAAEEKPSKSISSQAQRLIPALEVFRCVTPAFYDTRHGACGTSLAQLNLTHPSNPSQYGVSNSKYYKGSI